MSVKKNGFSRCIRQQIPVPGKTTCQASALLKGSMPAQSLRHDGWLGFPSYRPNSACSLYKELRPPKNSRELYFESQVSTHDSAEKY